MIKPMNDGPFGENSGFRFAIAQVVHHRRYGYDGIIVARDASCQADEDWYLKNQTQPDRLQPWYHVLVHQAGHNTYVAEANLEAQPQAIAVQHPLLDVFFDRQPDGSYRRNDVEWPG